MNEFIINVSEVEELQTIRNITELETLMERARKTIIQGGSVILQRNNPDGSCYQFDEITTEAAMNDYKMSVFKYL